MPKSARRDTSKGGDSASSMFASEHDYSTGMECTSIIVNDEEFPPLPVTPSKPPLAKKPTLASDDAVRTLSNLINTRSDGLELKVDALRTDIKVLNEKVVILESRVESCEVTTKKCMTRLADLETYGRRWNLRLQGLPEAERENVREEIVNICQHVLPAEKEKIPDIIDVAHRIGKGRRDDQKPRGVILRFISRRYREMLWKAAKNNAFLQSRGLRFTEDLSKEDRENRNKLWPKIEKAREDGMTAYYVGGRGFINGTEIQV